MHRIAHPRLPVVDMQAGRFPRPERLATAEILEANVRDASCTTCGRHPPQADRIVHVVQGAMVDAGCVVQVVRDTRGDGKCGVQVVHDAKRGGGMRHISRVGRARWGRIAPRRAARRIPRKVHGVWAHRLPQAPGCAEDLASAPPPSGLPLGRVPAAAGLDVRRLVAGQPAIAFLDPFDSHRWRAPGGGRVLEARVLQGQASLDVRVAPGIVNGQPGNVSRPSTASQATSSRPSLTSQPGLHYLQGACIGRAFPVR